jgi:hypothetical protein
MIGSFWPIALVAFAAMGFVCRELARDCASDSLTPRGNRAAVLAGLQSTLPLTLVLSFVLVPSTATRIFKTFLCDVFEYDHGDGLTHRFLHDDLALSCDTEEYSTTRHTALVMIAVWPIGVHPNWDRTQDRTVACFAPCCCASFKTLILGSISTAGVPVMYARLLLASCKALLSGVPTAMSRATAFLSGEKKQCSFGNRSRCVAS